MAKTANWRTLHGALVLMVVGVALAFLIFEHLDHLLPYFPFLILFTCPLMHVFMHKGHTHSQEQEPGSGSDIENAYRRGLEEGRRDQEDE